MYADSQCWCTSSLPQTLRASSLVRGSLRAWDTFGNERGNVMKNYNKANIPLAKELRKNMTPWERKLWYEFLRSYPIRFQRQKAIGNYITDFYCAKAKLVLELDGGGHYTTDQLEKDAVRTKELECMGMAVLRISNLDVDRNFAGVCESIDLAISKRLL